MNVFSLVFALVLNKLLIPLFGIAGAAISSMSYQIMQCIWMNLYLYKMGYWPYKFNLTIQGFWIISLTVLYALLNYSLDLSLGIKAAIYGIVLLLIASTFVIQGLAGEKAKRIFKMKI